MNRLSLPDNTLRLLAAQVNLNGTFNHACRFKNIKQPWSFALQVERALTGTLFTIITGTEKHSLTVYDTDQDTCRVLADFIECIANGCMETAGVQRIECRLPVETFAFLRHKLAEGRHLIVIALSKAFPGQTQRRHF